jgi:predicted nucleic acid-binding Zn finger protein
MQKKRDSKYFGKYDTKKSHLDTAAEIEQKKKIKIYYDDFKQMLSYQDKVVKFAKWIKDELSKKQDKE